tara:strand:- start:626 stop:1534 length:909 start_codon:yes stop_codon:yes gene_type:complete
MKIYSFYNEEYECFVDTFVNSLSLTNPQLEPVISRVNFSATDLKKKKIFNGPPITESPSVVANKLSIILKAIKDNPGDKVLYADIDTKFLNPFFSIISHDLQVWDILGPRFSRRSRSKIYPSFLAFRATPEMESFFRTINNSLATDKELFFAEAFNSHVKTLKHSRLSLHFSSSLLSPAPVVSGDAFLFHAATSMMDNTNIQNKTRMLKYVQQASKPQPQKQEIEPFVIDFLASGCMGLDETPLNLDCEKLTSHFYDLLTRPGCKSCARRRVLKKYKAFIDSAHKIHSDNPGAKITDSSIYE